MLCATTSARQSPVSGRGVRSANARSTIRSTRSSRVDTWRYSDAAPVPSSAATRRIVTAARPSASATATPAPDAELVASCAALRWSAC